MTADSRRVAVVSGGAAGIGRATARRLTAAGYKVVVFDRASSQEAALSIQGDATNPADVARLAAAVPMVHVLVNAVGFACDGAFESLTPDSWRQAFDLNLTSVFLVTQALLPALKATSGDRAIVNLSSTLARVADPQTIAYGTMKAALEHFTKTLALDLAQHRIRVLTVAPGPVANTQAESQWPEESYRRLNPLGRFATPEEIAALIAFLASPEATYITGATYPIDGGDSALGIGWGALEKLGARPDASP